MTDQYIFDSGEFVTPIEPADDRAPWLRPGRRFTVESVDIRPGTSDQYLKLEGAPSTWKASRFRLWTEADRLGFDDDADQPAPARRRSHVLATADHLISGDRESTYGDAGESFDRIAALWTALIGHPFTATDVARCMVALKLSRLHGDATHLDSWVDIAGYAALGAEIATR